MGKGQTFLSDNEKTPGGLEKRHLRIIISNPDEYNEFLVVSVTTWYDCRTRQDSSCILEAGCHSFITHKSWVDFSRTRSMSFTEVFNGLQRRLLIKIEDMNEEIIKKIQAAAKKSDYIPTELYHFFDYF
jgi:hypothetical protein